MHFLPVITPSNHPLYCRKRTPHGVVVNVLNYDIIVSKFKLQLCYVHFKTGTLGENSPVGWGCRTHWLHLCRRVIPSLNLKCLGYDTKSSDGEALGNMEYLFIALLSRSTLTWSGSIYLCLINGSNWTVCKQMSFGFVYKSYIYLIIYNRIWH